MGGLVFAVAILGHRILLLRVGLGKSTSSWFKLGFSLLFGSFEVIKVLQGNVFLGQE